MQMSQNTETIARLTRQQEGVLLDMMDLHTVRPKESAPIGALSQSQATELPTLVSLGLVEAQQCAASKAYRLSKTGKHMVTDLRRKNAAAYRRKHRNPNLTPRAGRAGQ